MYFVVKITLVGFCMFILAKGNAIPNTNYILLEKSLLSRPANLVNLSQAFFPTNRQASVIVEVKYYFNSSTGNITYASTYRWLDSSVNIFVRHDILHYFALYMYNVEVRYAELLVDEIQGFHYEYNISSHLPDYYCRPNSSVAHHLLNNLTVNVKTLKAACVLYNIN